MVFILTYKRMTCIYILNQYKTPKGVSNMQRIAQLLHSIKTTFNINSNFRRYQLSIFHEKKEHNSSILKLKTFKNRTSILIKNFTVPYKKA